MVTEGHTSEAPGIGGGSEQSRHSRPACCDDAFALLGRKPIWGTLLGVARGTQAHPCKVTEGRTSEARGDRPGDWESWWDALGGPSLMPYSFSLCACLWAHAQGQSITHSQHSVLGVCKVTKDDQHLMLGQMGLRAVLGPGSQACCQTPTTPVQASEACLPNGQVTTTWLAPAEVCLQWQATVASLTCCTCMYRLHHRCLVCRHAMSLVPRQ